MSKGLGGNIGCRETYLFMISKGFPNVTTSGQQYNIGEKPSVIQRRVQVVMSCTVQQYTEEFYGISLKMFNVWADVFNAAVYGGV